MAVYKKSAEMRKSIVEAMALLVRKNGYEKTNIRDISEYLNIPRSLIYYYFKNKDDIMHVLYYERFSMTEQLAEKVLYWRGFVAQINEVKAGERFDYGLALTASRDMKVAVTSFGYSDGYPDDLPGNGGFVMIKGQKAPILSLNMDQGFVDITDIPDVCVNDQMLLIGQDGDEEVELTELLANSKHSGTYFFSLINHRVRRIFKR